MAVYSMNFRKDEKKTWNEVFDSSVDYVLWCNFMVIKWALGSVLESGAWNDWFPCFTTNHFESKRERAFVQCPAAMLDEMLNLHSSQSDFFLLRNIMRKRKENKANGLQWQFVWLFFFLNAFFLFLFSISLFYKSHFRFLFI